MNQPAGRVTFGSFVLDAGTARFVGSEELAFVLGFTPGEVVLTAMMVASHLRPADQARWQAGVQRCLETGQPQGSFTTGDGRPQRAAGDDHVDRTARRRPRGLGDGRRRRPDSSAPNRHRRRDRDGGSPSAATRSEIDQAKGIVMAVLDVDADQAFALLKWHSSHSNRKLRDLSAELIDRLASADPERPLPQRLATVFTDLGSPKAMPSGRTVPAVEVAAAASLVPRHCCPGS